LTNLKKIPVVPLVGAPLIGGLCSTANVGGFLDDIINQVAPGVGTALDEAHAQAGRPLDHAAGPYVYQGFEMRAQFNRGYFR
jgi:hypothetical protein